LKYQGSRHHKVVQIWLEGVRRK